MYDREALGELLRTKALKFGKFTLASGREASFFLDCKQVTLDATGLWLTAHGILEQLQGSLPDAVGGMAIGADPITAGIVAAAGAAGTPLRGFLVRKEPKGHGTDKLIEGPVSPGESVVLVEDVVTTGGSTLAALDRAEAFGLKVQGVYCIVDRLAGGREAFAARGLPLHSLFSIEELGVKVE